VEGIIVSARKTGILRYITKFPTLKSVGEQLLKKEGEVLVEYDAVAVLQQEQLGRASFTFL
jgi:hypothetical protein